MRVMVIVKASKGSEAGQMPSRELLAAMGNFNEQLAKAGVLLDGAGLRPSSQGVRVRFSGASRTVSDGPFAETKELIAGYWLWKVESLREAIDWVKKCPNPMDEDSDIEIRPLFEADDLGEAFTPELREQEAAVLAAGLGLAMPRFENRPSTLVAGHNARYTRQTRGQIPEQWHRFSEHLATKLPGQVGADAYGVSWDARPNCDFQYLTGVEVAAGTKLPAEFTSVSLLAGRYVAFTHGGHVSALASALDTIWTRWVPNCGLKFADAPCFERYTPEFNPHTGLGGMEIWIPLAA